jgi:hypothetical protein
MRNEEEQIRVVARRHGRVAARAGLLCLFRNTTTMDHCLRHVPDTCVEISLHELGQSVHGALSSVLVCCCTELGCWFDLFIFKALTVFFTLLYDSVLRFEHTSSFLFLVSFLGKLR